MCMCVEFEGIVSIVKQKIKLIKSSRSFFSIIQFHFVWSMIERDETNEYAKYINSLQLILGRMYIFIN